MEFQEGPSIFTLSPEPVSPPALSVDLTHKNGRSERNSETAEFGVGIELARDYVGVTIVLKTEP